MSIASRRAALLATIRTQHGVYTLAQARAAGVSDDQLYRQVKSGSVVRVGRGVFRVATAPANGEAKLVSLCFRSGGLASHRSAGALWGLDVPRVDRCELVVPYGSSANYAGAVVHRSKQFELAERSVLRAIPTTGLARTVLDCAAVVGRRRLDRIVDSALRTKNFDWPDLYRVLVRHSAKGRDGCGKLRALLDERYGEKRLPDSAFNRGVAELLVDANLTKPTFEHSVHDDAGFVARVDLAYPNRKLAIELDSVRWHLGYEAFHADRAKRNRLMNLGWRLLVFTWTDYVDAPLELVAQVRAALAQT